MAANYSNLPGRAYRARLFREGNVAMARLYRREGPRVCVACGEQTTFRRSVEAWQVPWCRDDDGIDRHPDLGVRANMTFTGVTFEVVPLAEVLG